MLALPVLALAPLVASAPVPEESLLVRQVRWPVVLEERKAKGKDGPACERVQPADVVVEEDGARVEVTSIQRHRIPLLHVILVDVSNSMRGRLEATKTAAAAYLRELPPGERAMVLAFDDSLVLLGGPTGDREALEAAIERLQVGLQTALWDALDGLASALEPLPDLKALVLLSDGEDTVSLRGDGAEGVIARLATMRDFSAFVIGIDLPPVGSSNASARALLSRLTQDTGGRFYDLHDVHALGRVFQDLRDRLEARSYVTYTPAPFGRGPSDDAPRQSFRLRQIRVREREGLPCRIRNAGPALRLEGRSTWATAATERDPMAAHFEVSPPSRVATGVVRDVLLERGALFRGDSLRLHLDRKAETGTRRISMAVPDRQLLERTITSPAEAMAYLLDRAARSPSPAPDPADGRSPFLVNGATFLAMRRPLALALMAYEDYRTAARPRLRREIDAETDAILGPMIASGEIDASEARAFRDAMGRRVESPEPNLSARVVAEWLGDVPAIGVALGLERKLAQELLARPPDSVDATVAKARSWWTSLTRWLAPATDQRIVVPLVPVYDPVRDVVGFHRILLPRPTLDDGPPRDLVGPRPRAVEALAHVMRVAGVAEDLRRLDVWGIGYGEHEASRGRRKRHDAEHEVRIGFAPRGASSPPWWLAAHFVSKGEGPACFEVERGEGLDAATDAILANVEQAIRRAGVLCEPRPATTE